MQGCAADNLLNNNTKQVWKAEASKPAVVELQLERAVQIANIT